MCPRPRPTRRSDGCAWISATLVGATARRPRFPPPPPPPADDEGAAGGRPPRAREICRRGVGHRARARLPTQPFSPQQLRATPLCRHGRHVQRRGGGRLGEEAAGRRHAAARARRRRRVQQEVAERLGRRRRVPAEKDGVEGDDRLNRLEGAAARRDEGALPRDLRVRRERRARDAEGRRRRAAAATGGEAVGDLCRVCRHPEGHEVVDGRATTLPARAAELAHAAHRAALEQRTRRRGPAVVQRAQGEVQQAVEVALARHGREREGAIITADAATRHRRPSNRRR